MKSKISRLFLFLGLLIATTIAWGFLGFPTSLDEATFLHRLSSKVSAGVQKIILSELMPGDWELVCSSHSYDGPLYLKQYNKTFPTVASDDGGWGLIFISKDGSFSSAVGSCGRQAGTYISLEPHFCVKRSDAVLSRSEISSCTTFGFQSYLDSHKDF